MDVSKTIEEVVKKIQKDPTLITEFTKDPGKVLKSLGIEVNQQQLNTIMKEVASRVDVDDLKRAGKAALADGKLDANDLKNIAGEFFKN